ncbi:MAG: hypothetical protein ACLU6Y_09005 [Ruminococcus sp.]
MDLRLHKWIDGMNEEQRAHLITELFSVLEATGAETIQQILDGGGKVWLPWHGVWINWNRNPKPWYREADPQDFCKLAGASSDAGA